MNKLAALAVLASSSLLAAQGDDFQVLVADYQSALTTGESVNRKTQSEPKASGRAA